MNTLVVDDELLGRQLICSHIQQLPQLKLVAALDNAIAAKQLLKEQKIDLLFLDIDMPVMSGLELCQQLPYRPQVIFTTAYRQYAVEGFELCATDYLLKPITFSRFMQAFEKAQANTHTQTNNHPTESIFVKVNRKQVKLKLADIYYIKGLKDYIEIFTHNEKFIVKQTMTAVLQQLTRQFMRIHRSYIINCDKVSAISKHDVELAGFEIPIGDSYKKQVMHLHQNCHF